MKGNEDSSCSVSIPSTPKRKLLCTMTNHLSLTSQSTLTQDIHQ